MFRTDLAIENMEEADSDISGVISEESNFGDVKISRIRVIDNIGVEALGRPIGNYITVEVPPFTDDIGSDEIISVIKKELKALIKGRESILVIGLGNTAITPDALGPRVADKILATRHISGEVAKSIGMDDLKSVAVLAPGVLGQTGIETGEIIKGVADKIKPDALIVIDALASRRLSRLGCTVQMSDTGISPGAGVGNKRMQINEQTIGLPVISIGVPTVVDAVTLAYDLTGHDCHTDVEPRGAHMIVTPQEIDLLIDRAASTVAHAINCAIQHEVDPDVLLALV